MQIRVASEEDIPDMHRVRMSVRENQLGDPAWVQPEHYRAMLMEHGRGWVAEMDGRIAGFAVADLARSNVWALFVDPAFEGRGIGRRLHDTMLDWMFAAGAEQVWLSTDPGTRAERFYAAAGWRHAGREPNGEARYEMSREQWQARARPSQAGAGAVAANDSPQSNQTPMSNLQAILDEACEATGVQRWMYGDWPLGIAARLGAPEVAEIIRRLDALDAERDELPEWDGDGSDDIWRTNRNFSRLLSAVARKFPAEVSAGLGSPRRATRLWMAQAIGDAPDPRFVPALEAALAAERDDNAVRILTEALETCRKPPSFFSKLLGR